MYKVTHTNWMPIGVATLDFGDLTPREFRDLALRSDVIFAVDSQRHDFYDIVWGRQLLRVVVSTERTVPLRWLGVTINFDDFDEVAWLCASVLSARGDYSWGRDEGKSEAQLITQRGTAPAA